MGKVVRFHAQGREYPISVMDRDGQKWVTAQQLGEAMGHTNIRKLIIELQDRGELQGDKHWKNVSFVQPGDAQARTRILLSYRGAIRVAMHCEAQRAREFRDWAEEVLLQVMVTGSYGTPTLSDTTRDLDPGMMEYIRKGFAVSEALRELSHDMVAKIVHFRRLGLTQKETAAAIGLTRYQVQFIEEKLLDIGVKFSGVNVNKRDREIRGRLLDNLFGGSSQMDGGGTVASSFIPQPSSLSLLQGGEA